jgi:hypothetical protein
LLVGPGISEDLASGIRDSGLNLDRFDWHCTSFFKSGLKTILMLAGILTQVGKQSGRYPAIFFRLSHCNIADGSLLPVPKSNATDSTSVSTIYIGIHALGQVFPGQVFVNYGLNPAL